MQPSASIPAGRAAPAFISAQAASPAFSASLEAAPNSPGNSENLFQQWLATQPASPEASAVASQNTSEFFDSVFADLSLQDLAPPPDSTSTSRPPMQPSASSPAGRTVQAVLFDASNMLTGFDSSDMTPVTGRNTLNVLNHLHDIARLKPFELAPGVREAALSARDDPKQLVHNLLALCTANPPVLSSRRGSSVQPANQPPGHIGAQAASPAFSASLEAAPNSLRNWEVQYQQWLAEATSPEASAVASQYTSEFVDSAVAVQWYHNRREDLLLVDDVYPRYSEVAGQSRRETERSGRALFSFAASLSQDDTFDSLGAFLLRYGSTDTNVSEPARNQVDAFIGNQGESSDGQRLRVALDLLCDIPTDQRNEMCRQDGMTEADVSRPHRLWLLPPSERALIEPFEDHQSMLLSKFSAALLRGGHGGLSQWLAMVGDGRARIARQLLSRHGSSRLIPVLDQLQDQAGIPSARRLRGRRSRNTGLLVSSQTAQTLPVQPATPMPASPAMSEANSEEMFQIFLAEGADVVSSQLAEAFPAAPPTGDLIAAMSRLRETRQHRQPESVAHTARALGLDAEQLAAYVTDDGNLHTYPLVQQWLLTLPPDELDALLRFQGNG